MRNRKLKRIVVCAAACLIFVNTSDVYAKAADSIEGANTLETAGTAEEVNAIKAVNMTEDTNTLEYEKSSEGTNTTDKEKAAEAAKDIEEDTTDDTDSEKDTKAYERYYQFKKFTSENGLDGTAVKCVMPSEEGFLWIGGYSGLQRYDGTEFKSYTINGKHIPVNDIVQDKDGELWIATNGEGLFRYDSDVFCHIDLGNAGEAAHTANKILRDSKNRIWIGTKDGLYVYDRNISAIDGLSSKNIVSMIEIESGKILAVAKAGNVYLVEDNEAKELIIPETENTGKPRCCAMGQDGNFFIGTSDEQILKLNSNCEVVKIYEDTELKCINSISGIKEGMYWVCTDTGIGLLTDEDLIKLDIPLTDSVEEVCRDYEGNYWFVSSRQGILQVFPNLFADLGTYLGINKTVNSIEIYQQGLYIGCDDGIYCFNDEVPLNNELTESCRDERIRQIYEDHDGQLWVSTYYSGLKVMDAGGHVSVIDSDNSGLETDQIRCTYQRKDGDMLVGTEQGVYLINKDRQVTYLTDDDDFNDMRVLDVREAENGKIYVSTDGYGVYVINDGRIENIYTKQQGLLSSIVMKVVPSGQLNGVWLVSGIGIDFLTDDGEVIEIEDIGMSNVLSIELMENGEAMIYAANGLFRIQERDLLQGNHESMTHYKRNDGLPIDFTANSWNTLDGHVLYMCGTEGLACIDLNRKSEEQDLKIYIYGLQIDGKELDTNEGKYIIPTDGYRLTLDVRCINFIYKNYDISYYMEGIDQKETIIENGSKSEIGYINLTGGDYNYHFKILSKDNGKCLAEMIIPIHKIEKMTERSEIQILFIILAVMMCSLIIALIIYSKERGIKRRLARKYQNEKEQIIKRMAYRDTVTGIYNRNLFEEDKKETDIEKVSAVVLFSVNHLRYIRQKLGVLHAGEILRHAVEVAGSCEGYAPKLYRLSDNVFCGMFFEPVELDKYIMEIKSVFSNKGDEMKLRLSLAVGGIYNNRIYGETIDIMITRCEKIRLLDEKRQKQIL